MKLSDLLREGARRTKPLRRDYAESEPVGHASLPAVACDALGAIAYMLVRRRIPCRVRPSVAQVEAEVDRLFYVLDDEDGLLLRRLCRVYFRAKGLSLPASIGACNDRMLEVDRHRDPRWEIADCLQELGR